MENRELLTQIGSGTYQRFGARFGVDFEAFLPLYAAFFILLGKVYCPGLIVCNVVFGVDIRQKASAPAGTLAFDMIYLFSPSARFLVWI